MGSLLPLSNSSTGPSDPLSLIPLLRNIENTAAASVADTIAPSNNPSRSEKLKK